MLVSQVPPAQTLQKCQASPSHSAAQMRCSENSLVDRIPLPASSVSQTYIGGGVHLLLVLVQELILTFMYSV